MTRTINLKRIAALPILVCLAWLAMELASLWQVETPRWILPEANGATSYCEAGMQLGNLDTRPVSKRPPGIIVPSKASYIADRVILHSTGRWQDLFGITTRLTFGPELVEATFPDGQRRLAWYRLLLVDDGGATLLGRGGVIYVDAHTGQALLWIPDVTIGDPWLSCQMDFSVFITWQRPLAWLVAYLLVLGTISGIIGLARRAARGKPPAVIQPD